MIHKLENIGFIPFVSLSPLFEGCNQALDSFQETCDFSWGDNKHSLVTPLQAVDTLADIGHYANSSVAVEVGTVISRINKIPDGVLIDLES